MHDPNTTTYLTPQEGDVEPPRVTVEPWESDDADICIATVDSFGSNTVVFVSTAEALSIMRTMRDALIPDAFEAAGTMDGDTP